MIFAIRPLRESGRAISTPVDVCFRDLQKEYDAVDRTLPRNVRARVTIWPRTMKPSLCDSCSPPCFVGPILALCFPLLLCFVSFFPCSSSFSISSLPLLIFSSPPPVSSFRSYFSLHKPAVPVFVSIPHNRRLTTPARKCGLQMANSTTAPNGCACHTCSYTKLWEGLVTGVLETCTAIALSLAFMLDYIVFLLLPRSFFRFSSFLERLCRAHTLGTYIS